MDPIQVSFTLDVGQVLQIIAGVCLILLVAYIPLSVWGAFSLYQRPGETRWYLWRRCIRKDIPASLIVASGVLFLVGWVLRT